MMSEREDWMAAARAGIAVEGRDVAPNGPTLAHSRNSKKVKWRAESGHSADDTIKRSGSLPGPGPRPGRP